MRIKIFVEDNDVVEVGQTIVIQAGEDSRHGTAEVSPSIAQPKWQIDEFVDVAIGSPSALRLTFWREKGLHVSGG